MLLLKATRTLGVWLVDKRALPRDCEQALDGAATNAVCMLRLLATILGNCNGAMAMQQQCIYKFCTSNIRSPRRKINCLILPGHVEGSGSERPPYHRIIYSGNSHTYIDLSEFSSVGRALD